MSMILKPAVALLLTLPLISCSSTGPRAKIQIPESELVAPPRPALPGPSNADRAQFILKSEAWGDDMICYAANLANFVRILIARDQVSPPAFCELAP